MIVRIAHCLLWAWHAMTDLGAWEMELFLMFFCFVHMHACIPSCYFLGTLIYRNHLPTRYAMVQACDWDHGSLTQCPVLVALVCEIHCTHDAHMHVMWRSPFFSSCLEPCSFCGAVRAAGGTCLYNSCLACYVLHVARNGGNLVHNSGGRFSTFMHAWMVHVVLDCFGALVPDEQAEVGGVKVKKTVTRTVACRINPARSLFCMHAISYMLPVPCPQDSEDAWKDVLRSQKAQPITHDKTSYIYRVASYIFVFRYRCLRLHWGW